MNGHQLRDWRTSRNLSQAQAAELLGCSRRALQNWEARNSIPKYIALAISAVSMNLPEYGTPPKRR